MSAIDDYLGELPSTEQAAVRRVYDIALQVAPHAEQGMSYGMPALRASGKPLLAVIAHKAHLSIHPFSSEVVAAVAADLPKHSLSKGTVRFSLDVPVPESVIERIVELRLAEIAGR